MPDTIETGLVLTTAVSFFLIKNLSGCLQGRGRFVLNVYNCFNREDTRFLISCVTAFSGCRHHDILSRRPCGLHSAACAHLSAFLSCLYFYLRFPCRTMGMIGHQNNGLNESVGVGRIRMFDKLLGRAERNKSTYLVKGPSPPVCDAHLRRALEHAVIREGMKISVGFEMPVRPPVQLKGTRGRTSAVVNGALAKPGGKKGLRKGLRSEEEITMEEVVKEGSCRILAEDALQIDRKVSKRRFREEADGVLHVGSSLWVDEIIVERNERSPKTTRVSKSVSSPVKRLCDKEGRKKRKSDDELEDMDIVPSKVDRRRHKSDATDEVEPAMVQEKRRREGVEDKGEAGLKETSWLSDDYALLKKDIGNEAERKEGETSFAVGGPGHETNLEKTRCDESSKRRASAEGTITFTGSTRPKSAASQPESGSPHDTACKAKGSITLLSQKRKLQLSVTERPTSSIQPVQKVPRLSSITPSASPLHKFILPFSKADSVRAPPSQTANCPHSMAHTYSPPVFQEPSTLPSTSKHVPASTKNTPSLSRDTARSNKEISCDGSALRNSVEKVRSIASSASSTTITRKQGHVPPTKHASKRGSPRRKQDRNLDTKQEPMSQCPQLDTGSNKVLRTQCKEKDVTNFSDNPTEVNKDSLKIFDLTANGGAFSGSKPGSESELTSAEATNTHNADANLKLAFSSATCRKPSSDPDTTVGTEYFVSPTSTAARDTENMTSKKVKVQAENEEVSIKNGRIIYTNEKMSVASRKDQDVGKGKGNNSTRNQKVSIESIENGTVENSKRGRSAVTLYRCSDSIFEPKKLRSERPDKMSNRQARPARRKSVSQFAENVRYQHTLGKLGPLMKQAVPLSEPDACLMKNGRVTIPSFSPSRRERTNPRTVSETNSVRDSGGNDISSVCKSRYMKGGRRKSTISTKLYIDIEGTAAQSIPFKYFTDELAGKSMSGRAHSERSFRDYLDDKTIAREFTSQKGNLVSHRKCGKEATSPSLQTTNAVSSILPESTPNANQKSGFLKHNCPSESREVYNEHVQRYLNISKDLILDGHVRTVFHNDNQSSNPKSSRLDDRGRRMPTMSPLMDWKDSDDADEIMTYCFNSHDYTEKMQSPSRAHLDDGSGRTKSTEELGVAVLRPRRKPSLAKREKADDTWAVKRSKMEEEAESCWPRKDIQLDKRTGCNRRKLSRDGESNQHDEDKIKELREHISKNASDSATVKCRLRIREHIARLDEKVRDSSRR